MQVFGGAHLVQRFCLDRNRKQLTLSDIVGNPVEELQDCHKGIS